MAVPVEGPRCQGPHDVLHVALTDLRRLRERLERLETGVRKDLSSLKSFHLHFTTLSHDLD